MDDGLNINSPDRPIRSLPLDEGARLYTHRSTGPFVSPSENTWAAHNQLIKRAKEDLGFDKDRYFYFDGIVAAKLGNPALTNPKHADFARYEAMRNNIAVLRNFVLMHYEESGLFKNGSFSQRARIESLAESLGQALANDKWGTRAFTKSTSVDVANIDGVGTMEMYKHLLDIQENPTARQPMIAQLKTFLALPDRDWKLPPLSASPFSPQALAAPPPGYVSKPLPKADTSSDTYNDSQERTQAETHTAETAQSPRAVEQMEFTSPEALAQHKDALDESIAIVEHAVQVANSLQHIDTLAEIPREESVEEARKILRFLRNMEFADHTMEEFLDQGTPSAIVGKKQAFSRLTDIFAAHLRHAQTVNPTIASTNSAVEQARDTICTMALELAEHTRRMLREGDEREERLNQLIDSIPHTADLRITQPVDHLLETYELGLEHASGRELATTTLERLLLSSERLEKHAILLKQPNENEEGREESIALARHVLNRMEQLPIGDRTLMEFIEHGTPKEQAAFAQQVEELVGIYRNIIIEATQNNGEVTLDPKLKEANDAIGGFAHAVKLMAAKEMPNSIASAQQIGAEASQEPSQWKDLSHHAVNRLIKSAEGGLEKAIGEIASDAEEQDEDLAAELIAESMTHLDNAKRKKKRKRESSSRSGKGAKKQKKKLLDITADDYALKQGRFAEDSKEMRKEGPGVNFNASRASKDTAKQMRTMLSIDADDRVMGQGRFADQDPVSSMRNNNLQNSNSAPNRPASTTRSNTQVRPVGKVAAPQGLKEADLAAIAKLGGSLRDIGNQLQGLSVASVSSVDKVVPDSRTAKQQQQDRDMNAPRNQGGPGK